LTRTISQSLPCSDFVFQMALRLPLATCIRTSSDRVSIVMYGTSNMTLSKIACPLTGRALRVESFEFVTLLLVIIYTRASSSHVKETSESKRAPKQSQIEQPAGAAIRGESGDPHARLLFSALLFEAHRLQTCALSAKSYLAAASLPVGLGLVLSEGVLSSVVFAI